MCLAEVEESPSGCPQSLVIALCSIEQLDDPWRPTFSSEMAQLVGGELAHYLWHDPNALSDFIHIPTPRLSNCDYRSKLTSTRLMALCMPMRRFSSQ